MNSRLKQVFILIIGIIVVSGLAGIIGFLVGKQPVSRETSNEIKATLPDRDCEFVSPLISPELAEELLAQANQYLAEQVDNVTYNQYRCKTISFEYAVAPYESPTDKLLRGIFSDQPTYSFGPLVPVVSYEVEFPNTEKADMASANFEYYGNYYRTFNDHREVVPFKSGNSYETGMTELYIAFFPGITTISADLSSKFPTLADHAGITITSTDAYNTALSLFKSLKKPDFFSETPIRSQDTVKIQWDGVKGKFYWEVSLVRSDGESRYYLPTKSI